MSVVPSQSRDVPDSSFRASNSDETRVLESDVVRRVQGGDLGAYQSLLLEHGHARRLRAWLAVRAPFGDVAEDVAQEAFITAYRRIGRFRAGTDFGAWLRAVAFQLLRQARKKFAVRERQRAAWLVEAAASETPPPPQSDSLIEHLEHCLERVPAHIRTLLTQRYHDGTSMGEIGRSAGQSPEWVRTTLYRARRQLRECIERRQHAGES
jgi:RNA polymerase sigma-70 factor (ECF subfamily)